MRRASWGTLSKCTVCTHICACVCSSSAVPATSRSPIRPAPPRPAPSVRPFPSAPTAEAARTVLLPLLTESGIWMQNPLVYHSSLYHASHHRDPKPAVPAQIDEEEENIRSVVNGTCPVRAVVERVTVTPGGVFMVCWNVLAGGEPAVIRRGLREALPRSPRKQLLSDEPILHTTLARVLKAPVGASSAADAAGALKSAAWQLSRLLCGVEVVFAEACFVEEFHALALALNGRFAQRPVRFSEKCPAQAAAAAAGDDGGAGTAAGGEAGGKALPAPPKGYNSYMIGTQQVEGAASGLGAAAAGGGGSGSVRRGSEHHRRRRGLLL